MTTPLQSLPCRAVRSHWIRLALTAGALSWIIQVDAASLNDWLSRQPVEVPRPGLVRVALSPETLEAAQSSLVDLRVLDPAGAEVPYLLEQPRARSRALRPQEGWQVFLEANRTRIEIDVNLRGRLTAVSLETPASDFLKPASLTATANGTARVLFSGYPIFRQPGGVARLQLKLPDGAWTHLTLVLDDARSRPVPITGLVLQEEESPAPPPEVGVARLGERIESVGETRLTIDLGAAHLPLAGLRFHTDEPLFVRRVNVFTRQWTNGEVRELSLGNGTIYRVAVEGQTNAAQLDLGLDAVPPTRELVVAIDNGDSPPLPLEAVEVLTRPTYLVFLARQAGAFQMFSGNPRATAPRYDVAALASQLKDARVSLLKPGGLGTNAEFRPSEPLPEIPVFAAALDAASWSFHRVIKTTPGAVQQLELTPHVLAHAQAGLSDLRLVAAGRQLPFILERAGFTRALSLEASRGDDPKRPRLGRWILRLPQPGLPITQLSCETKATLFQRDARVSEEIADRRGDRYPRLLGSASWVRRPNNKSIRLSVVLSAPPQTDTLLLEVDHGDNPPIELEKFQVSFPVTRVLFKAPPGERVELCYGNAKAIAPAYDLDLVASQILTAAKSEATLADADPDGPGQPRLLSRNPSLIFFGVLALVVIGLVLVITRLLPKPSQAS